MTVGDRHVFMALWLGVPTLRLSWSSKAPWLWLNYHWWKLEIQNKVNGDSETLIREKVSFSGGLVFAAALTFRFSLLCFLYRIFQLACLVYDHFKCHITKCLQIQSPAFKVKVISLEWLFRCVNREDFMVYTCFLLTAHIKPLPSFFLINMGRLNVNHHHSHYQL